MADKIVIEGVRPYDGSYDFDIDNRDLTTREWGWIKRLAGYLPVNLDDDGLTDPELLICFAAIALHRAGKVEAREVPAVFETLSDAPFGSAVRLVTEKRSEEEPEGDALPPVPDESSSLSSDTSGPDSLRSSETSVVTPDPSGMRGSAGAESDRLRSVS